MEQQILSLKTHCSKVSWWNSKSYCWRHIAVDPCCTSQTHSHITHIFLSKLNCHPSYDMKSSMSESLLSPVGNSREAFLSWGPPTSADRWPCNGRRVGQPNSTSPSYSSFSFSVTSAAPRTNSAKLTQRIMHSHTWRSMPGKQEQNIYIALLAGILSWASTCGECCFWHHNKEICTNGSHHNKALSLLGSTITVTTSMIHINGAQLFHNSYVKWPDSPHPNHSYRNPISPIAR